MLVISPVWALCFCLFVIHGERCWADPHKHTCFSTTTRLTKWAFQSFFFSFFFSQEICQPCLCEPVTQHFPVISTVRTLHSLVSGHRFIVRPQPWPGRDEGHVDTRSADAGGDAPAANRRRQALCGSDPLSPCCVKDGCCHLRLVLLLFRALGTPGEDRNGDSTLTLVHFEPPPSP